MMFVDDPSFSLPYASSVKASLNREDRVPSLHSSSFVSNSSEATPLMAFRSPGLRTPLTDKIPDVGVGWRKDSCNSDTEGKEAKDLDSQLWHACAGGMVQLPSVGAEVIYFPQGHSEQAATPPDFPSSLTPSGTVSCRVLSIHLHADLETDEVYARMELHPDGSENQHLSQPHPSSPAPVLQQLEKSASFAKTLTQSDANNGGGFSVPRYCAETIFPRLDYSADPPVQTILVRDVQGHVWKFRHIYRGTPRRHLLTTGWSTFVNQKKLVAGDAIVFLRGAGGNLCVGVRRSMRGTNGKDMLSWPAGVIAHPRPYSDLLAPSHAGRSSCLAGNSTIGFARNRARVSTKSVLEAVTLAAGGRPFEVTYYPRASTSEFCVRSQAVRASLNHSWYPGMRFKMAFETEDASRISWFMGTISAVDPADPVFWPNSPWRLLQVSWDEPDLLQGVRRVSPWQVELVSTVPMALPPVSLPKKKFRVAEPLEYQLNETAQGLVGLPKISQATYVLGKTNPWHTLSYDVPVGMQGARHETNFGLTLLDCHPSRLCLGFTGNLKTQEHKNLLAGGTIDLQLSNYEQAGGQETLQRITTSEVNSEAESTVNTSSIWTENSTSRCASFILFGKAIHPQAIKEQPQLSGSSSSEGNSCHHPKETKSFPLSSSNSSCVRSHTDSVEVDGHIYGSKAEGDVLKPYEEGLGSYHMEKIVGLKMYKEQVSMMKSETKEVLGSTSEDNKMQCKVFLENEEIGWTVDLSKCQSYEELYDHLTFLFETDKSKLSTRIVYKDLEGSTIHVGGEPYRNFMQTVRRLTILSEPGSDMTS